MPFSGKNNITTLENRDMAKKIIKEMEIKFGPVSLKVVDGKINLKPNEAEQISNFLNSSDVIEVILPNAVKTPEIPAIGGEGEAIIAKSEGEPKLDAGGLPEGTPEEEALETPEEEAAEQETEETEEHEEEEEEEKENKNPFVSSEDINKIASLITEDINTNNGKK